MEKGEDRLIHSLVWILGRWRKQNGIGGKGWRWIACWEQRMLAWMCGIRKSGERKPYKKIGGKVKARDQFWYNGEERLEMGEGARVR